MAYDDTHEHYEMTTEASNAIQRLESRVADQADAIKSLERGLASLQRRVHALETSPTVTKTAEGGEVMYGGE